MANEAAGTVTDVIPGTDVVKDAIPDAVSKDTDNGRYSFDAAFGELVDDKPKDDKATVADPPTDTKVDADKNGEQPALPDILEPEVEVIAPSAEVIRLTEELRVEKERNATLANVQAAMTELEKAPEKFLVRHFPQLAKQLDFSQVVLQKLQSEFGADFRYDPADMYTPGTDSYKYRLRENELRDELVRERDAASAQIDANRQRSQALIEQSKKTVMQQYKLTEAQFQKEIMEWSQTNPLDFTSVAKLRFFDSHVKQAVDKALKAAVEHPGNKPAPKGANGVNSDSGKSGVPDHLKELQNEFGDIL